MADDKNIQRRIFERFDPDGTKKTVIVTWDKTKPMESFSIEADGWKGEGCIETLKGVEDAIGNAAITMKPEAFDGDKEQDVFIVGFGG